MAWIFVKGTTINGGKTEFAQQILLEQIGHLYVKELNPNLVSYII